MPLVNDRSVYFGLLGGCWTHKSSDSLYPAQLVQVRVKCNKRGHFASEGEGVNCPHERLRPAGDNGLNASQVIVTNVLNFCAHFATFMRLPATYV